MDDKLKIEAKDISRVYSVCSDILKKDERVSESIRNLRDSLRKIESAWISDGEDKESYTTELSSEIGKLESLNSQIVAFCNTIKTYINTLDKTSKKTVN